MANLGPECDAQTVGGHACDQSIVRFVVCFRRQLLPEGRKVEAVKSWGLGMFARFPEDITPSVLTGASGFRQLVVTTRRSVFQLYLTVSGGWWTRSCSGQLHTGCPPPSEYR